LIHDLIEPPLEEIGALPIDGFVASSQRGVLAATLNSLPARSACARSS
jgi:hypothetical protein